MTNKVLILILFWSALLAAWTFANPPAGTPGTTSGLMGADTINKRVGIDTIAPLYKLDVVGSGAFNQSIYSRATDGGATRIGLRNTNREWSISNYGTSVAPNGTFAIADETAGAVRLSINTEGLINMNNNRVINVSTPTAGTDAVNKTYVDSLSGGSNPAKLWGQGRPGAIVINTAGECPAVSGSIKISRSTRPASWGSAAAACPAGWWVCTMAERDINGASAGVGTCDNGISVGNPVTLRRTIECNIESGSDEFLHSQTTNWGWVSNTGSNLEYEMGLVITSTGIINDGPVCSLIPVWCCSNN